MATITAQTVEHIADLANIPITPAEGQKLADGFATTLTVVDQLMSVDTTGVTPTNHVTGLENVYRDDRVMEDHMFSQREALMNATQTHNGYFVVPRLIDQE